MIKDVVKNFFSNSFVRSVVSWLSHFYIFLVYKTSKIIIKGDYDRILDYVKAGKGIVLFTWHGRSLISPAELNRLFAKELKSGRKMAVLSSIHRDGKIAANIMSTFDIGVIEGSTINPKKGSAKNKKSLTSLRTTMKALTDGTICVLAPDGPRGPAFKMNTKITDIVKKTHTAIVCVSVSYKRKKQFKTWDYFQLAWPFNTIIIDYGKLIEPSDSDDIEKINLDLETRLNDMTAENDGELEMVRNQKI